MTGPAAPLHYHTIVAQATPSGYGGIAIVRVSGPHVAEMMDHLLGCKLKPRQATYRSFRDEQGETIDEGIALFFPAPHSFTGEDVLELQGHGGPVVVDGLLQRILGLGARLARPGEFSQRAFLNNRMDLVQAEAIADLIQAASKQAARSALRSLQGAFSNAIHKLNEKIIHLRMYIEAAIDFSDEEINFLGDNTVLTDLQYIVAMLNEIQQKAKQGSLLREGTTVVIAGQPNVGKSSLLNYLSGRELAIVTPVPGTTRDVLRNHILLDGMPIHIIDTAGLRESEDVVEQEGIRRAYHEIQQADMVLCIVDAEKSPIAKNQSLASQVAVPFPLSSPFIVVRNKIDLTGEAPAIMTTVCNNTVVSLSVKTGAGLDLLIEQIKTQAGHQSLMEGEYLARRRHLDALARAKAHVQDSWEQLSIKGHPELVAEDLRLAHLALCEITGEFSSEDLLGRIFSSFCIGK